MGNEQCEMQTYDPLRISASVVHPASFHIVNIIIVSFGMNIFKIDDPKAFCKGDADYPIFTYVPKGVEHIEKYAPHGKRTRWKVIGAIYGLIQASLRYFLKSSSVMEGLAGSSNVHLIRRCSSNGSTSKRGSCCSGSTWMTDGVAANATRISTGS